MLPRGAPRALDAYCKACQSPVTPLRSGIAALSAQSLKCRSLLEQVSSSQSTNKQIWGSAMGTTWAETMWLEICGRLGVTGIS